MNTENISENNESPKNTQKSDQNVISQKKILRTREEGILQKQQKKLNNEYLRLKNKLNKKSEKIQVINLENFQQRQLSLEATTSSISNTRQLTLKNRIHKFQNSQDKFNLLDYIVERKQNKHLKKYKNVYKPLTTCIKLNRGKKREIQKKHYSRLRKIILRNRKIKNENKLNSDLQTNKIDEKENTTLIEQLELLEVSEELKERTNKEITSITAETKSLEPMKVIHSRKFQNYCDNTTSKELCNLTENLLKELLRFQNRAFEKNQIKARAHKRYVVGFKEVNRQLDIRKTKLIILAPDCEKCDLPGGITDIINEIKTKCKNLEIPYVFCCNKRHLGYLLLKKVPVSCIGILNYDGAQDIFNELIKCLETHRRNYELLLNNKVA